MAAIFSEDFFWDALFWLFVAVTLFQMAFGGVVLWVFYADRGRIGQPSENASRSDGGDGVSIIICARNEAENLRLNLPSVLRQQYPGTWEVIVVDDDSEDETSAILLDFQRDNSHLRSVKIEAKIHPGKKQALAIGIQAATFDCILLTDADCAPASEYWIAHMMASLAANPQIELVLGYGPMKRSKKGGFLEKWTRFETAFTALQYFTAALLGMPYMGVGRNLAFKKQVFQRVGGFSSHAHLASGDDDLLVNASATASNTASCLHPQAFMYSKGKKTWKTWAKQKKRHLAAGTAYKWQHQTWLGMLSLSHSLHFFLLFLFLLLGIGGKTPLYLWLSRSLLLGFMYRKVFSDLREHGLLSLFPIYDALLAVYYGAFIPSFLIGKKTRSWN